MDLRKVVQQVNHNDDGKAHDYNLSKEGILVKRNCEGEWKLVIPKEIAEEVVSYFHGKYGHPGITKIECLVEKYCT